MARRSDGRFGGGEDFVPQLADERYWNRIRKTITFGASALTDAVTSFDTGMRPVQGNAMKWVIAGCLVGPNNEAAMQIMDGAVSNELVRFQLQAGEQTTVLDSDDSRVICEVTLDEALLTSGHAKMVWPLPMALLSPVPVFNKNLSIAAVASIDAVRFRLAEMCFEIVYGLAPVSSEELAEILMAAASL